MTTNDFASETERLRYYAKEADRSVPPECIVTPQSYEFEEWASMFTTVSEALADFERAANVVGSCGDGGCLVKRPVGMHTNGGCRCWTDKMKAQRMMAAGQRLYLAMRAT